MPSLDILPERIALPLSIPSGIPFHRSARCAPDPFQRVFHARVQDLVRNQHPRYPILFLLALPTSAASPRLSSLARTERNPRSRFESVVPF